MHIQKTTLDFLKGLQKNNTRDWFEKHRDEYLAAKENVEEVVGGLILKVAEFDPSVKRLTPKESLFRIYRDVRFSKNKAPYKPWFGAVIAKNGRKSNQADYYLHLEPGNVFLGCGMYTPSSEQLNNIRKAIDKDSTPLRKLMKSTAFKNAKWWKDELKTAPRGYAKDHPDVDLLRWKQFVPLVRMSQKDVLDKKFIQKAAQQFKKMKPLNDWLNKVSR